MMKILGLLLAFLVVSVGVHAVDTIAVLPIEKDAPESITSLGQIEQIARNTQKQFWKLVPPAGNDLLYIHPDRIVRAVGWDSKEWPDGFLKQMTAEMGTAGLSRSMYPFYRLTVVETRTGEMVYYNSYDQEVWRTLAPENYQVYAFALEHYGVASILDLGAQQKIYGRSSNVGLEILLLPEVFMDSYEEDVALEAQSMEITAPMTMLLSPPVVTNLMLTIGTENGEVEVGAFFPEGYTNPVSVFQCTSLMDWDWSVFTNISSVGISEFVWTPDTTGFETRFWVAARSDVDTDGDGLVDGHEIYLHKTNKDLVDTDGDTLWDGAELLGVPPTDPTLWDSNTNGLHDGIEVGLAGSIQTNGNSGVLVVVHETGWYHAIDPDLDFVYLGGE
ncbi:MAG: hypothetical protein KAU94_00915 [Verrucomicrobia bacterium]|nr:hypothetical protein [Verrucomicrobiota bacterium]